MTPWRLRGLFPGGQLLSDWPPAFGSSNAPEQNAQVVVHQTVMGNQVTERQTQEHITQVVEQYGPTRPGAYAEY